jgi:hypothetical protein
MIILVPAYGRDYKSKKAVLAAFHANKDFVLYDMWSPHDGKPVNKEQLSRCRIEFRYGELGKAFIYDHEGAAV